MELFSTWNNLYELEANWFDLFFSDSISIMYRRCIKMSNARSHNVLTVSVPVWLYNMYKLQYTMSGGLQRTIFFKLDSEALQEAPGKQTYQ